MQSVATRPPIEERAATCFKLERAVACRSNDDGRARKFDARRIAAADRVCRCGRGDKASRGRRRRFCSEIYGAQLDDRRSFCVHFDICSV